MVQPYEMELLNAGIQPLPVLQVIVSKLLHASESMDLLLRLNRLSETQGACVSWLFIFNTCIRVVVLLFASLQRTVGEASSAHTLPSVLLLVSKMYTVTSYRYTPNQINVFEGGRTLPGCSEVSLVTATPCHLQLCTVLGT